MVDGFHICDIPSSHELSQTTLSGHEVHTTCLLRSSNPGQNFRHTHHALSSLPLQLNFLSINHAARVSKISNLSCKYFPLRPEPRQNYLPYLEFEEEAPTCSDTPMTTPTHWVQVLPQTALKELCVSLCDPVLVKSVSSCPLIFYRVKAD